MATFFAKLFQKRVDKGTIKEYYKRVDRDTKIKGGVNVDRQAKHPEYYAIKAYMILGKVSDDAICKSLGVNKRTFWDKVRGASDFTVAEAEKLSKALGRSKDEIFLT